MILITAEIASYVHHRTASRPVHCVVNVNRPIDRLLRSIRLPIPILSFLSLSHFNISPSFSLINLPILFFLSSLSLPLSSRSSLSPLSNHLSPVSRSLFYLYSRFFLLFLLSLSSPLSFSLLSLVSLSLPVSISSLAFLLLPLSLSLSL